MEPVKSSALSMNGLCRTLMDYLKDLNTAPRTMDNYRFVLNHILNYFNKNDEINYSENLLSKYIKDNKFYLRKCDPAHLYFRTCMILQDLAKNKTPKRSYSRMDYNKENVVEPVIKLYKNYLNHKEQSSASIITKVQRIQSLQQYLVTNNKEIHDIIGEDILNYMNYVHINYKKVYAYNLLQTLKDFLIFLVDENIIKQDLRYLLARQKDPKALVLQSFYKIEEIQAILDCIDITTLHGIRDYLVVYLISLLGLRSNDVAQIKVKQINFSEKLIKFTQHKTKIAQILPLPDSLVKVILIYLKKRDKFDMEYLFIRNFKSRDMEPLSSSAISAIVSKHIKASGIEINGRKHGSHALRHSIASNMLNNDIDFPIVSKVLGHSSTDTTKTYAKISLELMRFLALEVPDYER